MKPKVQWRQLAAGAFKVTADLPGADPMWIWAEATDYRDHGAKGPPSEVWLAVERPKGQFGTKLLSAAQWARERKQIVRAELALPVLPERLPRYTPRRAVDEPMRAPPRSRAEVLIGVIDSGCPFAAPMLRRGHGTRVLSIWDQDDEPAFGGCGAYPAERFGYGAAIDRSALNKLMRQATSADGAIDEDRAYAHAGCHALRSRFSHGAAVLSQLFAGELNPLRSAAPSGLEAISGADLVFVDLPRAAVQDPSSAALARYVIDALRYIAESAGPKTKRIVVNLSSGTSRTSHDGASLLECALADWVGPKDDGTKRWIVVPAGNTNEEQRHALLRDAGCCLELFVPPDCETPQYVTVRWPAGAGRIGLRVTPPGGDAVTIWPGEAKGWFDDRGARCGAISPRPAPGKKKEKKPARSLLVFAPTASPDRGRALAPSGRWRFELEFGAGARALAEPVHFWVSRNQRNSGAAPRHRQAAFIDRDETHNPRRYLKREVDDPIGAPDNGIRRDGALSGLATVKGPGDYFVAVGSYVVSDPQSAPSRYSAAGPAAGTDPSRRLRPDLSAPGDMSTALLGLTVRGNRAVETVRVAGTSFSAPLAAREIAKDGTLPTEPMPLSPLPAVSSSRRAPLLRVSR